MSNRLLGEKSPYLLQHAENPVDWFPWGDEAFAKARAEQKLIFLSVGYSTCHWCHVMERESFEKEAVAAVLNAHFISVKVDREERPDVDHLYMTFVQATTGQGGWPMSVWLTPDLKPIYGGTYFPPIDSHGRPGFVSVLKRLAEIWRDEPEKLQEQSGEVMQMLETYAKQERVGLAVPGRENLKKALVQLNRSFDSDDGGFGNAPKFPRPSTFNFLFRYRGEILDEARAVEMAVLTLRKMSDGGMHDHIGGGFHRYSVDTFWHVPHYEKMLYDQAQLAASYLEAYLQTRDESFATTARDIFDYVLRDMTAPEGGFYSAEDADSLPALNSTEKTEGAFYVWEKSEIESLLGPQAAPLFCRAYGVEALGNSPAGSDPHGELRGKNTLILRSTPTRLGQEFGLAPAEVKKQLAESRAKLFAVREKRPRPHLDDKILTSWNGMMVSALARGGRILREPRYLAAAERAAAFVKKELYDPKSKTLRRSYRKGPGRVAGFAADYAEWIEGLIDLYEATGDWENLKWSLELQVTQDRLFWDETDGSYFSSAEGDVNLMLRMKEDYDGAEPSANSVAALNLLRLATMLDRKDFSEKADRILKAQSGQIEKLPHAVPQLLVSLAWRLSHPRQIVLAGDPGSEELDALRAEAVNAFLPTAVLLYADGGKGQEWLGTQVEFLKGTEFQKNKATAYVCQDFVCQLPVSEPAKLREILEKTAAGK